MQVTLTVISGPHLGREYSFEEHSSFIAGRSKKTQFRLLLHLAGCDGYLGGGSKHPPA